MVIFSNRERRQAASLLSIQLSIHSDIVRHPEGRTTADHAVRQRFTAFLPDFLLPFGRLRSVRWGEFQRRLGDGASRLVRHLRSNPTQRRPALSVYTSCPPGAIASSSPGSSRRAQAVGALSASATLCNPDSGS